MIDRRNDIRTVIGKGAAYAAALPWLGKAHEVIFMLAYDGVRDGMGTDVDIQYSVLFTCLALVASAILFGISRALLRSWHKPALMFVLGMICFTAVQDLKMIDSFYNIELCGQTDCNRPSAEDLPEPQIRTLQ
ncbi:hypothetical protein V5T82_10880 [Magnetovibrio sp. PR-2]|uniref:hypothetical protein n=1 Tax=Magnetovibrio sp. PR-2 TaxID=3120356 RepID=UPI002FCE3497